ncbi:MAG TPA: 16S rRNA (cytosine(1402)-N(4))-methyltransferase RsmH [Candidatus Polarisedimenticolia bacterium]|nr:16S rRNA (cytosine(1402)-N(4))-methyltransferase RsmH [Candidatus Polarisedimenticolia bacterium]
MEHRVAHRPVLLREALAALHCSPGDLVVDGTVGAGGHAEAILQAIAPDGRLVGLDRDPEALALARARLAPWGDRVRLENADHRRLPELLDAWGLVPVDRILLDLGVSSMQLDDPERGFSFRLDGPLDMRMDRAHGGTTAADLVNGLPERELRALLQQFGEEPHAARIASAIVRERERSRFTRTVRLAETVAAAVPAPARRVAARRGGGAVHPATRTFQALRIAINGEIDGLPRLLEQSIDRLRPGGRMAVISFHSLEDRAVKGTFRALAHRCVCPRGLPVCGCGRPDVVRRIDSGAVKPSEDEARDNPRSRSARLRAVERL